ncbi:eCIS core domain-containing protein [Rhizobium ruizarguesonis]|nr:DUF4157 domain-containing protein [Rhizobium ruizarguesonis]
MTNRGLGLTVALTILISSFGLGFSVRPLLACGAGDWGCEARKAGKNINRAVIKASHDVNRSFSKGFNQARTDLSKGLDRIDPRITQVGRDFDRWRLDFVAAVIGGPTLEAWLRQSRNDAVNGSIPIPKNVRQAMQGWYTDALMDTVGYKIGDNGELNVAHDSITYGDAVAVTLIDVIVFKNADVANDMSVWAHELHHVTQFNDWGVHSFAVQYVRSVNSVENPAYAVQAQYAGAYDPATNTAPRARAPSAPPPKLVEDLRLPVVLKMTQATSLEGTEVGGRLAAAYGDDVIHNMPSYAVDRANAVNFTFIVPKAGKYELNMEYAEAQARPVSVSLNGEVIVQSALAEPTGGFDLLHQRWVALAPVDLKEGSNTIRVERAHVFPHIHMISFEPI